MEPDYKNPSDYFQPAADDNSEEAQLRRKFFADHGSYLLFNDTLQNVYLGKDINGDPRYFVETVDLTYTVGQTGYGTSQSSYTFTYIPNFERHDGVFRDLYPSAFQRCHASLLMAAHENHHW